MVEGALRVMVIGLAVAGGLALLSQALRYVIRLVLGVAEVTAVSGMVEVSARRGDLTGLAEGRERERRARLQRRRDGLLSLLWLLWLIVPIAAGWLPSAYALAAPLWLLPSAPVRPPSAEQGTGDREQSA